MFFSARSYINLWELKQSTKKNVLHLRRTLISRILLILSPIFSHGRRKNMTGKVANTAFGVLVEIAFKILNTPKDARFPTSYKKKDTVVQEETVHGKIREPSQSHHNQSIYERINKEFPRRHPTLGEQATMTRFRLPWESWWSEFFKWGVWVYLD